MLFIANPASRFRLGDGTGTPNNIYRMGRGCKQKQTQAQVAPLCAACSAVNLNLLKTVEIYLSNQRRIAALKELQ
jgi:hypothetical protein